MEVACREERLSIPLELSDLGLPLVSLSFRLLRRPSKMFFYHSESHKTAFTEISGLLPPVHACSRVHTHTKFYLERGLRRKDIIA